MNIKDSSELLQNLLSQTDKTRKEKFTTVLSEHYHLWKRETYLKINPN